VHACEERPSVSESKITSDKIAVVKLGGSVLNGTKAFGRAALFLKSRCELAPSERLVVVVSAQKQATDELEVQARRIVRTPRVRTLDLLWCTGELRSVALLTLHLEAAGVSSVGLNVHETGLQFTAGCGGYSARPLLAGHHLKAALAEHAVVVVPGFLATRWDAAVVTLGRGGSDLSAVLLAIGLKASRCELVKDVPGYFRDDPREDARSPHLPSLTFEEALRMANRGCDLVQPRALLVAAGANLTLIVRSMDQDAPSSTVASGSRSDTPELHDDPVVTKA